MTRFLAIDLGAESGRAVLGSFEDGHLQMREVSRFANVPMKQDDSLRWDFTGIWKGVQESLDAASGEPLAGIGVDAWGCDYGLIDREGRLVEPPYHYRDHRTDGVMARVLNRLGRDRVYGTTGVQCLPFNTLYQLVAARDHSPDWLDAADRLLTIPDLVNHRLTGRRACEYTNATTTQCVDASTGRWAADLLFDLGIPLHLFGTIVRPGTTLGPVAAAASASLAGTPVIAPACHDTGSAFAAVETGGDSAFLSCGTWSLLGTEVPAPVITARSRDLNFTNEGGVGGTFRLLKNIGGLWLLQACRRDWELAGRRWSYEDLVEGARDDRYGLRAIVDPDDPAFLNPPDMPGAIAASCERTGQPSPEGPAGYTRAILDSLALKYRIVLDDLEEVSGRAFRRLRIVGGGSRNTLLNQLTADATGRPVLAGPAEATALGNIGVQMAAVGAVESLAHARAVVDRSFPADRYEPQPARGWDEALDRLRGFMGATRPHQASP